MKKKVLFVCIHNSARSQIAEALLQKYGKDQFEVLSAGFEPQEINPLAIEALLKDEGIDISKNSVNSVFNYYKEGKLFNYVITVCDAGAAQKCPLFPGLLHSRIHWSFEDPNLFTGTHEEKLNKMIAVKNQIKNEVLKFIEEVEKKR